MNHSTFTTGELVRVGAAPTTVSGISLGLSSIAGKVCRVVDPRTCSGNVLVALADDALRDVSGLKYVAPEYLTRAGELARGVEEDEQWRRDERDIDGGYSGCEFPRLWPPRTRDAKDTEAAA